jgi:predicted Ser/Thr protein kinase
MSLTAGDRLGPYEIVSALGAGGMGEVYRARDTRLGRELAIKVLSPGGAADPDRRSRFEQEARSASALNHPNIVTVLDIGDADGVSFIAMEYVEGRTLRELVAQGPLTIRRTLDIAAQLADGLAKAHAAGIVHRDLKPENVIVSKDGFAKILDFGLAKLSAPVGVESSLLTAAAPLTGAGAVLGTVGYMSPEQASGQPVDFRSDQFALGTIVYEMVTRKQPFQRATGVETLAAIIREDPEDAAQLNPRAPAPLRWIIERCLEKDPEDRFASTTDLSRDLASLRDHLSESTSGAVTTVARRAPRVWMPRTLWLSLGLLAGVAVGVGVARWLTPAERIPRFHRLTFRRGTILTARFTPDAQSVVYGAAWEGSSPEIFTVRFDGPESRSLGLPPADVLSISRTGDIAIALGRRYGFGWETQGTLARVALGGGAPRELLERVESADWAPDGGSLAVARDVGARRRLEFPIGRVLYETTGWISDVRVAPDGQRVAFWNHPQRGDNLGSLDVIEPDGSHRSLMDGASSQGLAWTPDGNAVRSGMFQVALQGQVRRVFPALGGLLLYDAATGGKALMSRRSFRREIVGHTRELAKEANLSWLDWSYPADLSSDGRKVLFDEQNVGRDGKYVIYVRRMDGSAAVRIGEGQSLALSPDDRWALAQSDAGTAQDLLLLPLGAGEPRKLPRTGLEGIEIARFLPNGRLLLCGHEARHANRVYVFDPGNGKLAPISPEGTTILQWQPVAPDGRWAVAQSAEGAIILLPVDAGEPRTVPGVTRDDVPVGWTADGAGLYVRRGSGVPLHIDVVEVRTGKRRAWKELTPPDPAGVLSIEPVFVSPDGQAYVYSYRRAVDDLFLVDGLQ